MNAAQHAHLTSVLSGILTIAPTDTPIRVDLPTTLGIKRNPGCEEGEVAGRHVDLCTGHDTAHDLMLVRWGGAAPRHIERHVSSNPTLTATGRQTYHVLRTQGAEWDEANTAAAAAEALPAGAAETYIQLVKDGTPWRRAAELAETLAPLL